VKAWERTSEKKPTARARDPNAMIAHMYDAFTVRRRFWEALGKKRRGVCQFHIPGAPIESWYVELNERGGVITGGAHPRPTAVWRSDSAAFTALMRGEAGAELFVEKRVELAGDLDLLFDLFQGLKARV
jgi:hypothetical protein